jgi:hypothetical protein
MPILARRLWINKNQCCGSGVFIPDPHCLHIPDPKTSTKEGVKKISCHTFFVATNFTKIVNYFIFEMPKKKIWPSLQRIIELFTQKFVTKL